MWYRISPTLLGVLCAAAIGLAPSYAAAQARPAPAEQSNRTGAPQAPTAPGSMKGCEALPKASAGGASVVKADEESLQRKSWQPQGGDIQFTVRSFREIPHDASVVVCFRWKTTSENDAHYIEKLPSRLELSSDGKLLKVTTTVPKNLGKQPSNLDTTLVLVPLADVRILAINKQQELTADAATVIGITYPWLALLFALIVVIIGLLLLYIAAARRLRHPGILQASWMLRVISTPSGFASLSQLQIIVWTFVVIASAVYVMSLSGQLIEITNGMLVLLGIAGLAAIGAKAHSETQGAAAEAAASKASAAKAEAEINASQQAAAATAAPANPVLAAMSNIAESQAATTAAIANTAKARVEALKDPPANQIPRWSDLIVNETIREDGTTAREIDVARFQMLLFTLITAIFVLMTVLATYVIPEISTGFQALLGISNGVYLGAKVVQKT